MITCGVEYLQPSPNPNYVYDPFSNTFEQITGSGAGILDGAYQGCLDPAGTINPPSIYATSVVSPTSDVTSLNVIHVCTVMLNTMVHDPLLMTLSAQIQDLDNSIQAGGTSTMDNWRWMDHYLLHEIGHSPLVGCTADHETEVYKYKDCVEAKDPGNPGE